MRDYSILEWTKLDEFPLEALEMFGSSVPSEVLSMWDTYGLGYSQNGFYQIVDPNEWIDFVRKADDTVPAPSAVPLLITCLGDVVVSDGAGYRIINYRHMYIAGVGTKLNSLFFFMQRPSGITRDPSYELANRAKERLGALEYGKIYGFDLLLPLGGREAADALRIVSARAHLEVAYEMLGPITRVSSVAELRASGFYAHLK